MPVLAAVGRVAMTIAKEVGKVAAKTVKFAGRSAGRSVGRAVNKKIANISNSRSKESQNTKINLTVLALKTKIMMAHHNKSLEMNVPRVSRISLEKTISHQPQFGLNLNR